MSTKSLKIKLSKLNKLYEDLNNSDGFEGGGSPRESLNERITDLENEIKRRQ